MPISYGMFEKQMKLLPIVLNTDGSASVTVRIGYVENDVFNTVSESIYPMSPLDVSSALDAPPITGLTRRDDLSFAIYSHLVAAGLVQPGSIA